MLMVSAKVLLFLFLILKERKLNPKYQDIAKILNSIIFYFTQQKVSKLLFFTTSSINLDGEYKLCCTTTTKSHWIQNDKKIKFQLRISDTDAEESERKKSVKKSEVAELDELSSKLENGTKHFKKLQKMNLKKEIDLLHV